MPDPRDSPWRDPSMVAGFARATPNAVLMRFAHAEALRVQAGRVLDLGCGAGRNAIPVAQLGLRVVGIDLSEPMLQAAAHRAHAEALESRVVLMRAAMDAIPLRDRSCDLVIAHGIWNLARSGGEFRLAVREAARLARPGAGLFVFTFSRNTLPEQVRPIAGESFVYTEFSGQPQCFLSEAQLHDELGAAGFMPDPAVPLTEYNRPPPGMLAVGSGPVIYEAAFRRNG